jgi:pimeloyl-ACP methyl ester carboxylesterase
MAALPQTLTRPGAQIRYVDSGGSGTPVVLTHGAGMDRTMFAPQADALRRAGFRTVTPDLRGHGASTLAAGTRFTADDALADLTALLDHLQLEAPVLVGHSLGGNLSQALVRRHPERAGGLIVLDATWSAGPLTRLEQLVLPLAAPALALVPASRLPGLMARASAVTPSAIAATEEVFAAMGKRTFLDVWRATVSLVRPDPGYRTPVPLGLIRGEQDTTGNIASAMPRWAQAEGVEEQVIPGAGHVVTLDAPEATSSALREILAGWARR